ncbi:MAG: heavy-metal-associated domain-containing protein [Flavobacteriales bacterium]
MNSKSFSYLVALIGLVVSFSFTTLKSKDIETSFWVNRDCPMCAKKIEAAADLKGVKVAIYNMDTYMLSLVYNPKKITIGQIHQAIADAGYDTDLIKASDDAYGKLPGCCQYDRSVQPK